MALYSPADRLPAETRLGRTALRVASLEPLVDFYERVVGLTVQQRDVTPALPGIDEQAILGTDKQALLVLEQAAESSSHPDSAGLFHNAFRVPSREALGDATQRLIDAGQLRGASDHRVSEALYLDDPEGNGIEIYRDRPREDWPRTADGEVQMTTDPLDIDDVVAAGSGQNHVPAGTDLGHVHLAVTSLSAFEEWYVDTVGFEIQQSMTQARFVSAGDYHHHIGANTWHQRTEPAAGLGIAWFEVVLPDTTSLGAVRERLEAETDVSEMRDSGFEARDPNGISVRFRVSN